MIAMAWVLDPAVPERAAVALDSPAAEPLEDVRLEPAALLGLAVELVADDCAALLPAALNE